jgi:hypothetical protein
VQLLGVLIGILGLFAVIGAVTGGGSSNNTIPNVPRSLTVASPPPSEPAIAIDASTLWAEYDANEVAADNRYKGRQLDVSGVVQSIDKDLFDNIVIHLRTQNQFEHVSATMKAEGASQAAQLRKRQQVEVVCKGHGRIMGSPMLSDCMFK